VITTLGRQLIPYIADAVPGWFQGVLAVYDAKGKQVAFRFSACESWTRWATPKWVADAGAKGVEFEFGKGPKPGGPHWDPDYLNPVFLEKLFQLL
jgi:hypothetical protein